MIHEMLNEITEELDLHCDDSPLLYNPTLVCCLLSAVCCLLSAVCRLLSVVCCLSVICTVVTTVSLQVQPHRPHEPRQALERARDRCRVQTQ
jgi:hypothetical protein